MALIHATQDDRSIVHCNSGICKIRIRLGPDGAPPAIYFSYAPGKPFTTIEGVQIVDNASAQTIDPTALESTGQLTQKDGILRIPEMPEAIDWTIQIIDYYR